MAVIWRTDQPHPNSAAVQEQVYNGLDSCVTLEVLEALLPQLNEVTQSVYDFERDLQAPILEMEMRGVLVDQEERTKVYAHYEAIRENIQGILDTILTDGLGISPINVGSWQQKQYLLYDVLQLPPVREKGKITTNRKALERLRSNFYAEPICNHILALQDVRKKLGFLKTGIDDDGRIRTSYNIGGTETGRLSSYESAFGTGTNLQNVTGEMRRIFVADRGKKFAYIDLEQAEARGVGAIIWNLFGDSKYLDFCESGDLHTSVCMMTWPQLGWTDDPERNKRIAKRKFYREFDYRDASKRLGHATNYLGKPPHISREVRIPLPLVVEFQRSYFSIFPGISRWHEWVRRKLLSDGWITTFLGRQRWFFGRRWDEETVREAIAYEPQSVVADILNKGLLAVWRANICELLLQVHDAILIQYPEEMEDEVVPAVQKLLEIDVPLMNGRMLRIPTEAEVGWNWGKQKDKSGNVTNVDGLVPYAGHDARKRQKVSVLD
jgi:DNA polymerase I-like protein with 3'-5' exonuclease and polymerase domains